MVEIDLDLDRSVACCPVSVLNREPMWLKCAERDASAERDAQVSVLNREPMWLKCDVPAGVTARRCVVSVLNREPMWLKFIGDDTVVTIDVCFSAQP